MGRLIYGTPSEAVEPPEQEDAEHVLCPNCWAKLYEGEKVYRIRKMQKCGLPDLEVFACEHCIDDFSTWVEDL